MDGQVAIKQVLGMFSAKVHCMTLAVMRKKCF